jgi:hypothetical protein
MTINALFSKTLRHALIILMIFISLFMWNGNLNAGEIGVDLYGISYHYAEDTYFNKDEYKYKHLNEFNPGIGIRYNVFENDY